MKRMCVLLCLLVIYLLGCSQKHDYEDGYNNNGGANGIEERVFDWENSVRITQEALPDVNPEFVERHIVHTIIMGARINGIIRVEEFESDIIATRAFEIESEDNLIFHLYLAGNHVELIVVPETGMAVYAIIE